MLVKQQPSTAYTAAFGCRQALLAIQQPLAAFKLCLLYSSLWLPSSFPFYTAAFGCIQALLAIQQPLAAFKLRLLNNGLLLPSSFACYIAAIGCLQVLLDTAAVGCFQALLACFAYYTALLNIQQPLAAF